MLKPTAITSELAQQVFTDAFRHFVGLGKLHSCESLAAETGIDSRTIESYRRGDACPSYSKLLRLQLVLPAEFTERLLAPASLQGVTRIEPDQISILAVNASITHLVAQIGHQLADGRIDHREEAKDADELQVLADLIHRYLADRQAKKTGAAA